MKRSRLVITFILLLILVGVIIGLTQWYKPHRKVEGEQGIVISADSLIAAYDDDEAAADAIYLNKTIAVHGTVAKVDKNQDGQPTVLFASTDPLASVFCTMRDKDAVVNSGKTVVIKGFCSGHTTDVMLTDCIPVK